MNPHDLSWRKCNPEPEPEPLPWERATRSFAFWIIIVTLTWLLSMLYIAWPFNPFDIIRSYL